MSHLLLLINDYQPLQVYYNYFMRWIGSGKIHCLSSDKIHLQSNLDPETSQRVSYQDIKLTYQNINNFIKDNNIDYLVSFTLNNQIRITGNPEYFGCRSICHYFSEQPAVSDMTISYLRAFKVTIVSHPSLALLLSPFLENIKTIPIPHLGKYHLSNETFEDPSNSDREENPVFTIGCDLSNDQWFSELDTLFQMIPKLENLLKPKFQVIINKGDAFETVVSDKLHRQLKDILNYHRVRPSSFKLVKLSDPQQLISCQLYLYLNHRDPLATKLLHYQQIGIPIISSKTPLTQDLTINGQSVKPLGYRYQPFRDGYYPIDDPDQLAKAILEVVERDYSQQVMSQTLSSCYSLCLGNIDNYQLSYLPIIQSLDNWGSKKIDNMAIIDFNSDEIAKHNQELCQDIGLAYYRPKTKPIDKGDNLLQVYHDLLKTVLNQKQYIIQIPLGYQIINTTLPLRDRVESLLEGGSFLANIPEDKSNPSLKDYLVLKSSPALWSNLRQETPIPNSEIVYNLNPLIWCYQPIGVNQDIRTIMSKSNYNLFMAPSNLVVGLDMDRLPNGRRVTRYRQNNFKIPDYGYDIYLKDNYSGRVNQTRCQWSMDNEMLTIYYLEDDKVVNLTANIRENLLQY